MSNDLLSKNYVAGAATTKYRIAKFGAADGAVLLAAAATDASIGVFTELSQDIGGRVDVYRIGLADVEYGGTVTRGDLLTSDATGRAVTAAPGAGVANRVIGVAEVSGVLGDIGSVRIAPHQIRG